MLSTVVNISFLNIFNYIKIILLVTYNYVCIGKINITYSTESFKLTLIASSWKMSNQNNEVSAITCKYK